MLNAILFRFYQFLCITQLWRDRIMDRLYLVVWPRCLQHCGEGVHIYHPCQITGPRAVIIGNNVHINRGAFIRGEGGLVIEDNVHVGRNLTLYTTNHNYSGDALPYDDTHIAKPVTIKRNVWIGINVTITPGVTVGEGAIIGAGTVVASDVPALAIVGSAPVRIIKYRDAAHYARLEESRSYGAVDGKLY